MKHVKGIANHEHGEQNTRIVSRHQATSGLHVDLTRIVLPTTIPSRLTPGSSITDRLLGFVAAVNPKAIEFGFYINV